MTAKASLSAIALILLFSVRFQASSVSGSITPASVGSGATVTLTGGAPTQVQSAQGSASSGSASATITFSSPAAPGDAIIVFARFGGTTISSVTDNQAGGSNSYTSVIGPTAWGISAPGREAQVFIAQNVIGGNALTITVKLAAGSEYAVYLAAVEYSGVDSVSPVNGTASGTGTVSTNGAPTTGFLTTTIANAKLVATGWDANESYTSTSSGVNYTTDAAAGIPSITGGKGWPNLTEDGIAATPGSYNATTTSTASVTDWAIHLVALAPVSPQTVTADSNGNYTFANVANGNYTVAVTKAGTSFSPTSQSIAVNNANVTGINFSATATTFSISGTISPSSSGGGAKVVLAGPAPTLVQSASGESSTGNASATVTLPNASSAGNTIIIFARFGGAAVSSVMDNQAGGVNSYTSVIGPTQWGVAPQSTDRDAQVFVAKNIVGGTKLAITVSLTNASTHDIYLAALEYSGVDPVNAVSATALGTGTVGVGGAPTTAYLTTTMPNTALAATSWDSNESYTSSGNGAGYTTDVAAGMPSLSGGSGWPNLTEYGTAVNPGSWNATASSLPAVSDWVIQLAALEPTIFQTVTADSNGNFVFNDVANGTYTVVPSESGATFTPSSQSVTVNGTNPASIAFTISVPTGTISGTVVTTGGTGISGATVSAGGQQTTTSTGGGYSLSNVPAGTVSVTASATGYQPSTQSVTVTANTATTQNFTLSASVGTISGTITGTGGTAISGATVSYSGGSTTTSSAGQYTLSNVPTGSVTVTAAATGYQNSSQAVTVAFNATTTANFALAALPGTITGTVTNASNGATISGATVSYSGGSTTTSSNGTYVLSNVAPGSITITVSASRYQSSSATVTAISNTTVNQNFALSPALGSISGTVTSGSGPLSGATVSYTGGSTTTSSNGQYTLHSVPVGTYTVTASDSGYHSSSATVKVNLNQSTTQNFQLKKRG